MRNHFRGSLPSEVENLSMLKTMDVRGNLHISGTVPEEYTNLAFMEDFGIHGRFWHLDYVYPNHGTPPKRTMSWWRRGGLLLSICQYRKQWCSVLPKQRLYYRLRARGGGITVYMMQKVR